MISKLLVAVMSTEHAVQTRHHELPQLHESTSLFPQQAYREL